MTFFMEHTMAYLDSAFVNKQRTSLEKYKQVMEYNFLAELDGSLQYIELRNSKGFPKWFECKICGNGLMSFINKRTRCIGA
jgi:hypothetical protein